jgi:hypothetical protein
MVDFVEVTFIDQQEHQIEGCWIDCILDFRNIDDFQESLKLVSKKFHNLAEERYWQTIEIQQTQSGTVLILEVLEILDPWHQIDSLGADSGISESCGYNACIS